MLPYPHNKKCGGPTALVIGNQERPPVAKPVGVFSFELFYHDSCSVTMLKIKATRLDDFYYLPGHNCRLIQIHFMLRYYSATRYLLDLSIDAKARRTTFSVVKPSCS
jgi:hypothetical protein